MNRSALLILIATLILSCAAFAQTTNEPDSGSVTLSVDDVKQLRKLAAEREFYKRSFEESERQSSEWRRSAENWRKLYEAEKDRADRVQEGRVTELQKAVAAFKDQAEADRQRLGELEFRIRKLKSQRKWWFAAGAAVGVAGGVQIARINF